MTGKDAHILDALRRGLSERPPKRLGIAVSGGSDSVALMEALVRLYPDGPTELFVATVDHGLRDESSREAAQVARMAKALGLVHTTLAWNGWDHKGNMQAAARDARYLLLSNWARENELDAVALAHTADDQAETVLMRLARASGVDGLSAMRPRKVLNGVTYVRPLLSVTRRELREFLQEIEVVWLDDPSNADHRYDRIKARKAMTHLGDLGITAKGLADVASYMSDARRALSWYAFLAARELDCADGGEVVFDLRRFRTMPDEIARRLLSRAIAWITRADYPPRRAPLGELLKAVRYRKGGTLGGCRVVYHEGQIWVCREYNAVRDLTARPHQCWDNRWKVEKNPLGQAQQSAGQEDYEVRALGEKGLKLCDNWRATGRPKAALLASPSVWRGDELIAAPLAGLANGWGFQVHRGEEEFYAPLLSH